MSRALMMERIAEASPRLKARIAGVFYLLTFLTGGVALFVRGRLGLVAGLIAGACYIAVTLLFYDIFKPVNRSLSLVAAFFSLVACAVQAISSLLHIEFGSDCWRVCVFFSVVIVSLIFKSTFLPR